uniref:Putative single-stranded DNA binding protein n=1 Tax=Porolithon onkodes TaxID=231751 RepID=A0A2Z2L601_9FLOR|nr:putative single-stranded DNA binding protein [Porolithon onkodes]ASB29770.1 putative single-stranded DNA binding protein [Porolithon onkodes]
MNIGLVTARIMAEPIRYYNFNYYYTEIPVNFLHNKNYLAYAIALADGEMGQNLFDIYRQGDYIMLQGHYCAVETAQQCTSLIIYITEVSPASLIMSK